MIINYILHFIHEMSTLQDLNAHWTLGRNKTRTKSTGKQSKFEEIWNGEEVVLASLIVLKKNNFKKQLHDNIKAEHLNVSSKNHWLPCSKQF